MPAPLRSRPPLRILKGSGTEDLRRALRHHPPVIFSAQWSATSRTADSLVLAVVALVVTVAGALVFLNTSTSNDRAAVEPSPAPPLELMALGHERDAKGVTISGTVRNPSGGLKLDGLTAVVSLLDDRGALLSTRDVPLDYRALGPGEETPFKLSISDPGSLARYRVSFRAGTAVVPHVDRRSHTKLASARE